MIPVHPKPEPADFDAKVRQKGLAWLNKNGFLVSGPIPAGTKLPSYWRDCLKELHAAYNGICAYVCIYIEPVTGSRTVEHFVAKSKDIGLAYEWSNYRLACGKMNSRKCDFDDVLDPFLIQDKIQDKTFFLDLVTGGIFSNPALEAETKQKADDTIKRLGLDDPECRQVRSAYFDDYINGQITSDYLRRKNPFVWIEAFRQNLLKPEDLAYDYFDALQNIK